MTKETIQSNVNMINQGCIDFWAMTDYCQNKKLACVID